ncbi:hypothetical protein BGZ60DRAFT_562464 [Tricladium varicosporioides]|nr:hypothetical protein BGZ60DRAFT_562464 [Hymenoscyphus varicosporioides]
MGQDIFPIHPIASVGLDPPPSVPGQPAASPDNYPPQPKLSHYEDGCIICVQQFNHNETIAKLHCGHLFHFICIRQHWDTPSCYIIDCPLCRSSPPLLHQTVGMTPEVADVWDVERVMGGRPSNFPNLPATYIEAGDPSWGRSMEEEMMTTSWEWNMRHGNELRVAHAEVAHVRRVRRVLDEFRRKEVKEEGRGVDGHIGNPL